MVSGVAELKTAVHSVLDEESTPQSVVPPAAEPTHMATLPIATCAGVERASERDLEIHCRLWTRISRKAETQTRAAPADIRSTHHTVGPSLACRGVEESAWSRPREDEVRLRGSRTGHQGAKGGSRQKQLTHGIFSLLFDCPATCACPTQYSWIFEPPTAGGFTERCSRIFSPWLSFVNLAMVSL